MEWKEATLGDIIHVKHGYPFKSEFFSFDQGRHIVLTPGNFYETGGFLLRPEKDRFYTGTFPESFILKKNDLIVAMTEQTYGLLGSPALIPEDDKYLHNQRLGLIQIKDHAQVHYKYLYYLFFTKRIREEISMGASGTKIRHTAPERIYRCKVLLPPLPTQRKIAAVLGAYDELIENNARRIALLEQMVEEIYREWFVRLRFPGHEGVKFQQGVPEGWEIKKIEDTFDILGGGTPSKKNPNYCKNGEINWYTPSDLTKDKRLFSFESIEKINLEGLQHSSAKLFPPYSIMMTSRATIGELCINTTEACTNQGFIVCIPNEQVPLYYLYYWLKANIEQFIQLANGATFLEITKGRFKKIDILVPKAAIIEKYCAIQQHHFNAIEILLRKLENLKTTRDLLLARLMSGRLAVEKPNIRVPPGMEGKKSSD